MGFILKEGIELQHYQIQLIDMGRCDDFVRVEENGRTPTGTRESGAQIVVTAKNVPPETASGRHAGDVSGRERGHAISFNVPSFSRGYQRTKRWIWCRYHTPS